MRMCELRPGELAGKIFKCSCGAVHTSTIGAVTAGSGAIGLLPEVVKAYGGSRAYIVADENTFAAAGGYAAKLLGDAGIGYAVHILRPETGFDRPEPTEAALGSIVMGSSRGYDVIIGVGGGVINDLCKLRACAGRAPYIYVPTCPSMDGYTSDSASVIYNGVKTSVACKCPDVLLADTDIISAAPKKLLLAGIGDMIAKYVSICEWRISALINGEYYCDEVAEMMRVYRRSALDNAEAAVNGDPAAVETIINGLCLVGTAMTYAGCSRPASGVEHYYSHLWDMRCLEERRQCELHGIQVGVGTLLSLRKYEKLKNVTPDKARAEKRIGSFDRAAWEKSVRGYFGSSADTIIKLEDREGKYDAGKCLCRFDIISSRWDEILKIIDEELIPADKLEKLFLKIGHPVRPEEFGESEKSAAEAFSHTSDIRDKYILTRLMFDLGIAPDEL